MENDLTRSPKPCPLCGSKKSIIFFETHGVPTSCNFLWKSKEEATNCPKGDIQLSYCPSCTYVENIAVDPQKNQYDALYDNSLYYSQAFQKFAEGLVLETIQKFNLKNKTILEITVGKVDFLSLFCDYGHNTGVKLNTFFVNAESNQMCNTAEKINPIAYDGLSSFEREKIDFVFCYSELEHVNFPKSFLTLLRKKIRLNPDASFFFSVPNALKGFEEGNYLDIIYEHVSYFTIPSLLYLFNSCNYRVLDISETKDFLNSIEVTASIQKQPKSGQQINSPSELDKIKN
ncbi:MAG TPA: methyltransferase domain-containing protein, partial [Candidatus Nanoarchaeia archaeon]|nr:methyltransferase domain-containing protein [Candidatus Nanoarchaeia archaeon]